MLLTSIGSHAGVCTMCHDDRGDTDKSVTAIQLERIIKSFMATQATNDLCVVFDALSKITWHTSPSKAVGPLSLSLIHISEPTRP